MPRILLPLLLVAIPVLLVPRAHGREPEDSTPEVTAKERDEALVRAFGYLDDKLFGLADHGSPRKQFAAAVAGLAYLLASQRADEGGSLPSRASQLKRIFDYLERYVAEVARRYDRGEDDGRGTRPLPGAPGVPRGLLGASQYNWPLGVAALYFAECSKRGVRRGDAKKALHAIARILEASQQEDGGWGHDDPDATGLGGPAFPIPKPGVGRMQYPRTLLAATNCAASGLAAACEALRRRNPRSLRRAIEYYERCQNGDGTFPYDPSQTREVAIGSATGLGEGARTAGALFALGMLGAEPSAEVVVAAARVLDEHPEEFSEGHGSATMALGFGALVSRARGEEAWSVFRQAYFARILESQERSGAMTCVCRESTAAVTCDTKPLPGISVPGYVADQKVYVTAIHALVLALDRAGPRAVPRLEVRPTETTSGQEGR